MFYWFSSVSFLSFLKNFLHFSCEPQNDLMKSDCVMSLRGNKGIHLHELSTLELLFFWDNHKNRRTLTVVVFNQEAICNHF